MTNPTPAERETALRETVRDARSGAYVQFFAHGNDRVDNGAGLDALLTAHAALVRHQTLTALAVESERTTWGPYRVPGFILDFRDRTPTSHAMEDTP